MGKGKGLSMSIKKAKTALKIDFDGDEVNPVTVYSSGESEYDNTRTDFT